MRTVGDLYGNRPEVRTFKESSKLRNTPLLGIEIELEQFSGPEEGKGLSYWSIEEDGSLRDGGRELVLRQPLKGYDLERAFNELQDILSKSEFVASKRCSTHVHVDVRNYYPSQIYNLTVLFAMFEKFFFEYANISREDNFYCYPIYKSEHNKMRISECLNIQQYENCPKYSSINLKTIVSYGSVEFRMQDAMDDTDALLEWCYIISKLCDFAYNYEGTISELLEGHSVNGGEQVFRQVFREMSDCFMSRVPRERRDVAFKECMRSAQDLIVLGYETPSRSIIREIIKDDSVWDKGVVDPFRYFKSKGKKESARVQIRNDLFAEPVAARPRPYHEEY